MKNETKRKIAKFIGISPARLILTKEQKEECTELRAKAKYEEIYQKYGIDAYRLYVPNKVIRAEIQKLKREGSYEAIRNKFGEGVYNSCLIDAYAREIAEAKGDRKAFLWKTGMKIKKFFVKSSLLAAGMASVTATYGTAFLVSLAHTSNIEQSKENASKYESMIDDYNEDVSKYIREEFDGKDYTHVQIFIKLMDDMWKNIDGYKEPALDIVGYDELDLSENGYGVCRNMAADVAKKLQALGYEAEPYTVYMGENLDCSVVPIERNILPEDDVESGMEHKTFGEESAEVIGDLFEEGMKRMYTPIIGNHKVVFVKIPEDNLTIVLDPTNLMIGVYKNGKIVLLNSNNLKDSEKLSQTEDYTPTPMGQFSEGNSAGAIFEEYLGSFEKPTISNEEIVKKYGIEAQQEAYDFFVKLEADERLEYQKSKSRETVHKDNSSKTSRDTSETETNIDPNSDYGKITE